MKHWTLLLACIVGCGLTDDPEMRALKSMLRESDEVVAEKQDAAIVILKENTVALTSIADAIETLKSAQQTAQTDAENTPDAAKESQPSVSTDSVSEASGVALFDDRPKLWVTYAVGFNCPPCDRMKADIASGELDGFNVILEPSGEGLRTARPAIRFEWAASPSGYAVIYEYSDDVRNWLKQNLLKTVAASGTVSHTVISLKNPPVPITKSFVPQSKSTNAVMSHSDQVALRNSLHGGGQWTWPGNLAEHLRTTHGVSNGNAQNYGTNQITGQRTNFRAVSFGPSGGWRARSSSRQSCPTCPR